MAAKLYVGKLAYSTTDDSLNALFATYGTVLSAVTIKERDTNQSKGFGFVEMEDAAAAEAATKALDGSEFEGRNIVVSAARPQEDRSGGGGNNFRNGFQPR